MFEFSGLYYGLAGVFVGGFLGLMIIATMNWRK